MSKYTSISSKGCVPEVELHNDYPAGPEKIEIKREMLSEFYNIPIGNVKKLVPNLFDKEKYVLRYKNLQLGLILGLKLKKCIVY